MANLKIFLLQSEFYYPFGEFAGPVLGAHGGKSAIFTETGGGTSYLELKGQGLRYENGEIVGGTITSMTQYNAEGVKYCALSDMNFSAADLPDIVTAWAYFTAQAMLKGNDKITGSSRNEIMEGMGGRDIINARGGNDAILGSKGNDLITGGAGADEFYLQDLAGHDTITDFNSKGIDLSTHDHILSDGESYTARQRGDDTLIEFDNNTSVTLLDFKKSQLDAGDISFM